MIQDQNCKQEEQNILNNPQSLQMIKQNLQLLMLNDRTQVSDIISHLQHYLSSIFHPSQPNLSNFDHFQRYMQELKERISQKSYHFSSIIQLSVRMVNYIAELKVKSEQDNQYYELEIDRLKNTIEELSNRNTNFQIDIQHFKEQLMHAREEVEQVTYEKQNLEQNFMQNEKELITQKDMRILNLEKELELIKHLIDSYKSSNNNKIKINHNNNDNYSRNHSLSAKSIHIQPLGQALEMFNGAQRPINNMQLMLQSYQQHIKHLEQQNYRLKFELDEIRFKITHKQVVNIKVESRMAQFGKLKTLPNEQSHLQPSQLIIEKKMQRSYTSKYGININQQSNNKQQEDINSFLQLLRIKKDNTSMRRDLSKQSLLKVEEFKQDVYQNVEEDNERNIVMEIHEDNDYKSLRKQESKNSFFYKRNNNVSNMPFSSSLVYLTQQQQEGCDNNDKQKYSWFFQSQELDHNHLIQSNSTTKTDEHKSNSSVGINTMSSSTIDVQQYQPKSSLKIKKSIKLDSLSSLKNVKMAKKQESKSFMSILSDFVVKRRIKRKPTQLNMQFNLI